MHVDPYYRAQVALASVISYRAMNGITDPVSATESKLWMDFYTAFWEAIFRAYVKREKARTPETKEAIDSGYKKALLNANNGFKAPSDLKNRLGIGDYAKILSAIGDLYDNLKYSSPEKEQIASPHECDLPKSWSL